MRIRFRASWRAAEAGSWSTEQRASHYIVQKHLRRFHEPNACFVNAVELKLQAILALELLHSFAASIPIPVVVDLNHASRLNLPVEVGQDVHCRRVPVSIHVKESNRADLIFPVWERGGKESFDRRHHVADSKFSAGLQQRGFRR